METTNSMEKRIGILYPMMVIAAITVIIISLLGIAAVTGLLPIARSGSESAAGGKQSIAPLSPAKSVKLRLATGSAGAGSYAGNEVERT